MNKQLNKWPITRTDRVTEEEGEVGRINVILHCPRYLSQTAFPHKGSGARGVCGLPVTTDGVDGGIRTRTTALTHLLTCVGVGVALTWGWRYQ